MSKTNRLAQASSPYLQQHAHNPVDWFEWGEEALQKAQSEQKPLLISIGYAACHWCHVMANESFTDNQIAAFMNEHFVCIKVDREERPDIDQIYMDAAHIISGRGGWPLNAVALPDGRPFYAATYFPPHQWLDVLNQLSDVYNNDPQRVLSAAESITEGISIHPFTYLSQDKKFTVEHYHAAFQKHIIKIDFELGGYKNAPKFMMPIGIEFLLQYHSLTQNPQALDAVNVTLNAMACGGLNDQISGGFARYSTDDRWLVPHFEKMLYDNAQLISLYAKAYQVTANSLYKEVIEKTISFVERELLDASGGFYASIDADSEHEEGKFYVFTKSEIEAILDIEIAELIVDYYNITEDGNWEDGKNILHTTISKADFAFKNGHELAEFETLLENANLLLFNYRAQRIRPTTDDKILCGWNALMISAYVNAYKATGNTNYFEKAIQTSRFIETNLLQPNDKLRRVYKDGKATVDAVLEDYALLADAWISLYKITFEIEWLHKAKRLAETVWQHFGNENKDMFYFTSDLSEKLIARKYEYSDNVIPASNSVMAHVFYKLAILFDEPDFKTSVQKMLTQLLDETIQHGTYYANWAMLLAKIVFPEQEIAVLGNKALAKALELQKQYLPISIFAGGEVENLPLLQNRLIAGKTLIYVCENNACALPVENVEDALKLIKDGN